MRTGVLLRSAGEGVPWRGAGEEVPLRKLLAGAALRKLLMGDVERECGFFLIFIEPRFFGLLLLPLVRFGVRWGVAPAEGTRARRVCCRLEPGVEVVEPGRLRLRARASRDCDICNVSICYQRKLTSKHKKAAR